jgi:predicted GNAT family N-acyltransferase
MKLSQKNFSSNIIENEIDKTSCYKLRFDVFSNEEKDYRYAVNNEFRDSLDLQTTTLIACKIEENIIGSLRFYPISLLNNEQKINYKLDLIHFEDKRIYIFDRVCVSKPHRKKGIFKNLCDFAESQLTKESIIVCAISKDKTDWINKYKSFGYVEYSTSTYKGWTGINLYKIV